MFNNLSIRNRLVLSIFIGCLIPYIVGGLYIKDYTEKWLYDKSINQTHLLLEQVSLRVDESIIEKMKELVTMMSQDERLQNSNAVIRNYTGLSENPLIEAPSIQENAIAAYFETIKASHANVNFSFFGTETGGYIEYPAFTPSAAYDPRIRSWYSDTLKSQAVQISAPYITKVTQEMVISITKRVTIGSKLSGVVGLSVRLDSLMTDINQLKIDETGYIVVVGKDGRIMVSPNHAEWTLKPYQDIAGLSQLGDSTVNSFQTILDGRKKIITIHNSLSSGWRFLSIVDKMEIAKQTMAMSQILYGIYGFTLFIIYIIIYFISRRITNPILDISEAINQMSTFSYNFGNSKKFEKYKQHKDEIGKMTQSLFGMENNFIELNENISIMDQEIRNIEIEGNKNVKLTLSENNPFNHIVLSINTLLEKTYSYLHQINLYNKDILSKNEQLEASEEKLLLKIEQIKTQKETIDFLAYHDPLTNLPNRRKFMEVLQQSIQSNKSGAVILLDLDNFKNINDSLGHLFGDRVLKEVSTRLSSMNAFDIFVSRFGGDEFLLLVECEDTLAAIDPIAKHIQQLFDKEILLDGDEIKIEFSMGISMFPSQSVEMSQLIMNADLALYTVKNNMKSGFALFDFPMTDQLNEKSFIESVLRDAIDHDGFKMVYQPQVSLETGEVLAYEALLRLTRENIMPGAFIPVAEDNGMIVKIGRIVTEKVIAQLSLWIEQGLDVKPVSVNYSAMQIHDTHYVEFLETLLNQYHVPANLLEIEITENVFLENKQATITFLDRLKKNGIRIAIDDFGTGYSSFSYLTFLPIDKIKLDRTLNMKFLELDNIKVMDNLIALAHSLNLVVVAEGIEEKMHMKRLKVGKCDLIQGYYFSKPLEADDVFNDENCNFSLFL